MAFKNLFATYLGIDLGTANTLVHLRGKGIVLREPSVVAIDENTKQVLAVGEEAKKMIGRTPSNIVAIRPLRDGVIADFDVTQKMLRYFINKALPKKTMFTIPKVVVGVPSGVTEVEKRAVVEAAVLAGAKEALLLEEPMAAAIGAGLPVSEPTGSMVVDIGGGTTEIAVISLGGIVTSKSIRVGGDELDEAIITYIKKTYSLLIGERTAEDIKVNIGSAYRKEIETSMEITGRNLVTGLPRTMEVRSDEILKALSEPVSTILEGIKATLEETQPELSADIKLQGIVLTGGGAMLDGLDRLISEQTEIPVYIADNALDCVAEGTAKSIEEYETLKNVFLTTK